MIREPDISTDPACALSLKSLTSQKLEYMAQRYGIASARRASFEGFGPLEDRPILCFRSLRHAARAVIPEPRPFRHGALQPTWVVMSGIAMEVEICRTSALTRERAAFNQHDEPHYFIKYLASSLHYSRHNVSNPLSGFL